MHLPVAPWRRTAQISGSVPQGSDRRVRPIDTYRAACLRPSHIGIYALPGMKGWCAIATGYALPVDRFVGPSAASRRSADTAIERDSPFVNATSSSVGTSPGFFGRGSAGSRTLIALTWSASDRIRAIPVCTISTSLTQRAKLFRRAHPSPFLSLNSKTSGLERTAFRFLNAAMRTTAMNHNGIPSSASSAQIKGPPR